MDVLDEKGLTPQTVKMTIVAQDPTVRRAGRILTASVRVPAQHLDPGPASARFRVIDYDASTGHLAEPAPLTADRPKRLSNRDILGDRAFHAQNVYAIAARTLAAFESALGRRLPWAFEGHQLYLVPHAFAEANAYYSDDDRSLLFGYFEAGSEQVLTCLSHDVVAHETAHAILDGLRHRFLEPSLPDQAAFHEALADVVALLSVFSVKEVLEHTLGEPDAEGRIGAAVVSPKALRNSLPLVLAEQMGGALGLTRGLRRSAGLAPPPDWRTLPAWEESHQRGEVLASAVLDTLVGIWTKRLEPLNRGGRLDRQRTAEEGAKSADHLLRMCLRGIDYLPPVDFEFEDFVAGVLLADIVLAPDDAHGYRDSLRQSFARLGIGVPPVDRVVDLAQAPDAPVYHGLNFAAMRTDVDEVFRFIWENAEWLSLDRDYYLNVESVRPSTRAGPDGLVLTEAVADYVQMLEVTAAELVDLAAAWAVEAGEVAEAGDMTLNPLVDPETPVQIFGGGTLVFDQFGRAKYHIRKPLADWRRQTARLDYLARVGEFDSHRRVGFSSGAPRGQRFAALHQPTYAGEDW